MQEQEKKRVIGRIIAWIMIGFLVIIVIPIGMFMFIVSGAWSALDRLIVKISK